MLRLLAIVAAAQLHGAGISVTLPEGWQGQVSLDETIALWERGEQLYKLCVGKLDTAQGKIEELSARIGSARPG